MQIILSQESTKVVMPAPIELTVLTQGAAEGRNKNTVDQCTMQL